MFQPWSSSIGAATENILLCVQEIWPPQPHVLNTPSHDPQTVCDGVETGHDEPKAPGGGNVETNRIICCKNR